MVWRPHWGLVRDLKVPLELPWERVQVKPRKLELQAVKRPSLEGEAPIGEEKFTGEQCMSQANILKPKDPVWHVAKRSLAYVQASVEVEELGQMYARVITAAEPYHIFNQEVVPGPSEWRRFAGRAEGPTFECRRMQLSSAGPRKAHSTAASPVLRWWGILVSNLSMYSCLAGGRRHMQQALRIVKRVQEALKEFPAFPWKEEDSDFEGSSGWKDRLTGLQEASVQAIQAWLKEARAIHEKVRHKVVDQARASYHEWLKDPMQNHYARGLFAITKEPSRALPRAVQGVWSPGMLTKPMELAEHRKISGQAGGTVFPSTRAPCCKSWMT